MSDELNSLHELAGFHRLEISFWDGLGNFRTAPSHSIISVLQSLGIDIESPEQSKTILKDNQNAAVSQLVDPVVPLWDHQPHQIEIRVPEEYAQKPVRVIGNLESGDVIEIDLDLGNCPAIGIVSIDNRTYNRNVLSLPEKIPHGYHRFSISIANQHQQGYLLSAPTQVFGARGNNGKSWGTFLPIYSLHSSRSMGAGDLTDFQNYTEWIQSLGGDFVATLPLFSAFLDEPCEPSPYSPLSRYFWNEFYVDFTKAPNWSSCSPAQELARSGNFLSEIDQLRQQSEIRYRDQWRLKRQILELLSQHFFQHGGEQNPGFRSFYRDHPEIEQYARFRAVLETRRQTWKFWPEEEQSRPIPDGSFPESYRRLFLFAQWLTDIQIRSLREISKNQEGGFYMDMPLGTHPDGFDCWYEPEVFADGVTGGAPPDAFFTAGQNWGFQPILPQQSRLQGHRYLRRILRRMTDCSNMVRIDHAMSLQRLYWIPESLEATEGLYVHYPTDELFAVLSLESHRQQCPLVAEDLGTVTPEIRNRLDQHGILRMYVGQFECRPDQTPPFNRPREPMVASLNTHDTPTATAFWLGQDIELRREMGFLDEGDFQLEMDSRDKLRNTLLSHFGRKGSHQDPELILAVLQDWMLQLAQSPARFLLVNLEDLWLEQAPQNVPGTGHERLNWQRKSAFSLEEMRQNQRVVSFLEKLNSFRSEPR